MTSEIKKTSIEAYQRVCPNCQKVITSMYPPQLEFNFQAHLILCKNKNLGDVKHTSQRREGLKNMKLEKKKSGVINEGTKK